MFFPIPSLDYKYEINKNGVVRNAKTKKIKPIVAETTPYLFCLNYSHIWICLAPFFPEFFVNPESFFSILQ